MIVPGSDEPGNLRDPGSQSGPSVTRVDPRTALTLLALIAAVAIVLWRADAAAGYGPFASIVAGVAWTAVWTLAVIGLGRPVMRRLLACGNLDPGHEVLAMIAGSALLVTFAAGLSVVGLFRPWPMLATVLLMAIAGAVDVVRRPPPRPKMDLRLGPLIGLAAASLLVGCSISPFYDQWHQHLGFPWVWLDVGSIHALPHDWYSFMPVNSSLLFAYGLKTLGPWSAQLIHWWSGVVTILGVGVMASRIGSRSSATWAMWILATTPVILHLSTTAGSDLVVTMFACGAWLALLETAGDPQRAGLWWLCAGVCVGFAVGTKYIALGTVAIPVAVAAIILHRPWRNGSAARTFSGHASRASASAVAVFAPWAIRNFVVTGNPLFPFANRLFAATLRLPGESAGGFSTALSGLDASVRHLVSGLDLGSFEGSIDGFPSIGFVYISLIVVVPLMWPILRRIEGAKALVAGIIVGLAFWLVTMHVSRYLVPILVPLAVVLGGSVAGLGERLPKHLRTPMVVLVGLVVVLTLAASVTPIGLERLGASLGVVEIDPLLERWVSSIPAHEPVSALDDQARVLLVAEARALGFDRPVLFSDPYRDPWLLDLVRTSTGATEVAERLAQSGVTHVLANRWEAVRSARLRGNDRFFVIHQPEVGERLSAFCGRCLEPIWGGSGLTLYRLDATCTVIPPGGMEISTW